MRRGQAQKATWNTLVTYNVPLTIPMRIDLPSEREQVWMAVPSLRRSIRLSCPYRMEVPNEKIPRSLIRYARSQAGFLPFPLALALRSVGIHGCTGATRKSSGSARSWGRTSSPTDVPDSVLSTVTRFRDRASRSAFDRPWRNAEPPWSEREKRPRLERCPCSVRKARSNVTSPLV